MLSHDFVLIARQDYQIKSKENNLKEYKPSQVKMPNQIKQN